jgi:hypothetical protein
MDTKKHFAKVIDELPISAREFADLILGDQIGLGMSRNVYNHKQNPDLVIKHEVGQGFQNAIEWRVWESVEHTPMAKWFAPCVSISPNGVFLIQKKVKTLPILNKDKYPKEIPAFFSDTKYTNFGMLGKNFVCFDYGTFNLVRNCFTKKMQKAKWWEEER